ncbi:MAG: sohB [Panacagrimonas sp.]|jgi:serine protease SohB|nr:protease SohB [Panacagrimonas sp.]MCC2657353.1 sohB [Panacagrimonas sp.]
MEFVSEYGLFLAKSVTLVVAVLLVAAGLFSMARGARGHGAERLEVRNLNERLRELGDALHDEMLDAPERKRLVKARRAEEKAQRKARAKGVAPRPRVFVLDFHGDLQAHAVASLRQEISSVLQVARKEDEILLRLESAGGLVHAYGLAASQLVRVRARGLRLTVAVDKVAASGGYLMACVADRILAAPFAVVGSIGVVAQIPNFNRLLRKNAIDLELHTAGEFKRTLTLFGENTEAARAKFREELEDTHVLFKRFIAEHRPTLDLDRVATGEHWFGTRAAELRLVDELRSSDDYLLQRVEDADVFEVRYRLRKALSERLGVGLAKLTTAFGRKALEPELP